MKKTISLIAAALVVSASAFALGWNPQPSSEQHLVGVTVGWMDKTMKAKTSFGGSTYSVKKSLTGIEYDANGNPVDKVGNTLQLGLTFTPEFTYGIGLQAGVYYEWTMNTSISEFATSRMESKCNNHEISIPVRLQWRYELVNGLSLYAFTGPSFDIGLLYSERVSSYLNGNFNGSSFHNAYTGKYVAKDADHKTVTDTKNRNDKNYKAFHPYWGFGVGFQWEYLRVQLTSDWGIMNVSANTGVDVFFHKPIALSFSYLF